MPTIEELRTLMRAAQVSGTGQYILSGKHLLKCKTAKYKRSIFAGNATAKESTIFEFEVIESNNPECKVGETRSYVDNLANVGALGRVKECILALIGVDPYKVDPEADAAATEIYVAMVQPEHWKTLGLPEDYLVGKVVCCEGFNDVSQKGKPIVKKHWAPVESAAA